jgi:hypothetical protein
LQSVKERIIMKALASLALTLVIFAYIYALEAWNWRNC